MHNKGLARCLLYTCPEPRQCMTTMQHRRCGVTAHSLAAADARRARALPKERSLRFYDPYNPGDKVRISSHAPIEPRTHAEAIGIWELCLSEESSSSASMLLTRGRAGLPLPALSLALVLLLAVMSIEVTIAADLAAGGTSDDAAADIPCPYQYERHSLEQVTSGQRRPWLWVSERECEIERLRHPGLCQRAGSADDGGRWPIRRRGAAAAAAGPQRQTRTCKALLGANSRTGCCNGRWSDTPGGACAQPTTTAAARAQSSAGFSCGAVTAADEGLDCAVCLAPSPPSSHATRPILFASPPPPPPPPPPTTTGRDLPQLWPTRQGHALLRQLPPRQPLADVVRAAADGPALLGPAALRAHGHAAGDARGQRPRVSDGGALGQEPSCVLPTVKFCSPSPSRHTH